MSWSRRAVLAGFGTIVGLPWLERFAPRAGEPASPKRLLIAYLPNGMRMDRWTPAETGPDWSPTPILAPLAGWRDRMTLISGLGNATLHEGEAHAVCSVSALSGRSRSPWRVEPDTFVTADHLLGAAIAGPTAPVLHLSSEGPALCGEAVSGTQPTCAPYWTISWADGATPIPPEVNPRRVFDRLFAGADPMETAAARATRLRREQSVLDFVRADAARTQAQLGAEDRARLDQYLTGVRELERRVTAVSPPAGGDCDLAGADLASAWDLDGALPPEALMELMGELARLALRCDHTRVVTWMLANERSDRAYSHLGLSESHHMISHHDGRPEQLDKLEQINVWEMELLAGVLAGLEATPDGDGTLLDRTTVLAFSGMSDPATHSQVDVPALLAGGEDAGWSHGEHVAFPGELLARLHLTWLRRLGADVASFGEGSTEELPL